MARYLMSDWLSTVAPDYTAIKLDIPAQVQMNNMPKKNQKVKFADDGTPLILNINSTTTYVVSLYWDKITLANAEIIMELWTDPNKANGKARKIVWTNPDDGNDYTVSFLNNPTFRVYPTPTHQGIFDVQLLVWGNYVP